MPRDAVRHVQARDPQRHTLLLNESFSIERLRGWITGEGDWNYWYYRACVLAMTILPPPDRPEPRDEDEESVLTADPDSYNVSQTALRGWTVANDEVARRPAPRTSRAAAGEADTTSVIADRDLPLSLTASAVL